MTKYMPETETPEINPERKFEVVKYPAEDGFRYIIYFPTEQAAAQAIIDFWNARKGSTFASNHLSAGKFIPIKHDTYTEGDRTHSYKLYSSEKEKHPGMEYKVEFNGNEGAIKIQGEEALRSLGLID
jgi:hypothetical protein